MKTEKNVMKRTYIGEVTSDKMDKTVVIKVERLVRHPLYKKYVKKTKKIKVHDEKNECRVGDRIQAIDCRPLSKEKSRRLLKIIERAK